MTRYFHGGVKRLNVGDKILAPAVTGVKTLADVSWPQQKQMAAVHDPTVVYLTTSEFAARVYAAGHPDGNQFRGGDVYEVKPLSEVERDPDYLLDDGGSVYCEAAEVVRVVERGAPRTLVAALARLS